MTNKRKYWLTKAVASLNDAYDQLGEATSLVPLDETFDARIDRYQALVDDIRNELNNIWQELK